MLKRIINLIITLLFLFNTSISSEVLADDLSAKDPRNLSPALTGSDMIGSAHQDISRIKMIIEADLRSLFDDSRVVDYDAFTDALSKRSDYQKDEFTPENIHIFYYEPSLRNGHVCLKCRVNEKGDLRNYVILVSLKRDEYGGFPVRDIFTEEAFARINRSDSNPRSGNGRFETRPGKSPEDAFTVIALSEMNEFDLSDYARMYRYIVNSYPELGYEDLAINWKSTARRDLYNGSNSLKDKGYLVIRPRTDNGEYVFELTPAGRQAAIVLRNWMLSDDGLDKLPVRSKSVGVFDNRDLAAQAISDLFINGDATHLSVVGGADKELLVFDQYSLDGVWDQVKRRNALLIRQKGSNRVEMSRKVSELLSGVRRGEIFVDTWKSGEKVVRVVMSSMPGPDELAEKIRDSAQWKRLRSIGGMLPRYVQVKLPSGVLDNRFLSRMSHVERGILAVFQYLDDVSVDLDRGKIELAALAHELGRLPFVHYSEKNISSVFPGRDDLVLKVPSDNGRKEIFNQTLAQRIAYDAAGVVMPEEVASGLDNMISKKTEMILSDEVRVFAMADAALGFVEDIVLSSKLTIEGKPLFQMNDDIQRIMLFVLGPELMSQLEYLQPDELDAFCARGVSRLLSKTVDPEILRYRPGMKEMMSKYRDSFESVIFPEVDSIVDMGNIILPAMADFKRRLSSRTGDISSASIIEGLLALDEERLMNDAGIAEAAAPVLEWNEGLSFDPRPYFIGMSMGGTKLYAALYEKQGQGMPELLDSVSIDWVEAFGLKSKTEVADPEKLSPDQILEKVAFSVGRLIGRNKIPLEAISVVGCTSPGPLSGESGIIGLNTKTFNLPFKDYPFAEKLAERTGLDRGRIIVAHDARSGLEGEIALGQLKGVKGGYFIIQGTGLGGSLASNGEYMTSFPELTEPGHHIVGEPETDNLFSYHYRFISRRGKKHPREVVGAPDASKEYQINVSEAGGNISAGQEKEENYIWFGSGERDMEDVVSGKALEGMLSDKHRLWSQFGGELSDYDDFNEPKDISELAHNGTEREKEIARDIIEYIGSEMGKAIATLINVSWGKHWQIERVVIGSTLGERLGISSSGEMLLTGDGRDFYFSVIRESAYKELTDRYGFDAQDARSVSEEILRTDLTQEIRETAGFGLFSVRETENVQGEQNVSAVKSMLIDLLSTSGDFEVKAVISAILMEMGHETESQAYFLSETREDIVNRMVSFGADMSLVEDARRVKKLIDEVLSRYEGGERQKVYSSDRVRFFLESLLDTENIDYEAASVIRLSLLGLGIRSDEQISALDKMKEKAEHFISGSIYARVKDTNKARQVIRIHALSKDIESGKNKYLRARNGRFDLVPGKSPGDALKVLAFSGLWERDSFTLRDFGNAYTFVSRMYPVLGFTPLAENWETTARRDLYTTGMSLVATGLLDMDTTDGVYRFFITDKGRKRIHELLSGGGVRTFISDRTAEGSVMVPSSSALNGTGGVYAPVVKDILVNIVISTYFMREDDPSDSLKIFSESLEAIKDEMLSRDIVFVIADEESVPAVDCLTPQGKKTSVRLFEYMDENNIYLFVDEAMARRVLEISEMAEMFENKTVMELAEAVMRTDGGEHQDGMDRAVTRIRRSLLHLIGNMCGLADTAEYLPDPFGGQGGIWRPVNDIDRLNMLTAPAISNETRAFRDTFTYMELGRSHAPQHVADPESYRMKWNGIRGLAPVHEETFLLDVRPDLEEVEEEEGWDGADTHEIEYREMDGRYRPRPGKSPMDALTVIALSGKRSFAFRDFSGMYGSILRGYPYLGFEPLAENWESTARKDLYQERRSLKSLGYLGMERKEGGKIELTLTEKGRSACEDILVRLRDRTMRNGFNASENPLIEFNRSPDNIRDIANMCVQNEVSHIVVVPGPVFEGNILFDQYSLQEEDVDGEITAKKIAGYDADTVENILLSSLRDVHKADVYIDRIGSAIKILKFVPSEKALRNMDGKFARQPGKSPEDALRVIALSRLFVKGEFSIDDFARAYKWANRKYGLEFWPMSDKWKNTVQRDLYAGAESLESRGYLFRIEDTRGYKFEMTPKALFACLATLSEEVPGEDIVDTDVLELIAPVEVDELGIEGTVDRLNRRLEEMIDLASRFVGEKSEVSSGDGENVFGTDAYEATPAAEEALRGAEMSSPDGSTNIINPEGQAVTKVYSRGDAETLVDIDPSSGVDHSEEDDVYLPDDAGSTPYFIGMSMGGTKLYAALYLRTGGGTPKILHGGNIFWLQEFGLKNKEDLSDPEKTDPDRMVAIMARAVDILVEAAGITVEELNNVGISSPGPVDNSRGVIGAGRKMFNLPFHEYPLAGKLAEAIGVEKGLIDVMHDARSGVEGEKSVGLLIGAKSGYYVIQGTGLGGSAIADGEYYKGYSEINEPGHHLVGTPKSHSKFDYSYRFIDNYGEGHPLEVVDVPDANKPYQITENTALRLIAEEEIEESDMIWRTRGESDLEDVVSGKALEILLKDKSRLAEMFGGVPEDYSGFKTPADISELAHRVNTPESRIAREIIEYIASEVGKGLAALIDVSYGEPWQMNRVVIGSTVAEKMGVNSEGKVLTTETGEDLYFSLIRKAVYEELTQVFGMAEQDARFFSKGIYRSNLTQEERETAGFDRPGTDKYRKEEYRDDLGRYTRRPGKSPEDALKVIALGMARYGTIRFTLQQYKTVYETVQQDYPELKFDPLAVSWESTVRRDLYAAEDSLESQGILVKRRSLDGMVFELTEKGSDLAEKCWMEFDKKADTETYLREGGGRRTTMHLDWDKVMAMQEMMGFADKVGVGLFRPVLPDNFTLVVSGDMHSGREEFEREAVKYRSRFNLERIVTDRPDRMVDRILGMLEDNDKVLQENVIVQLPKKFARAENREHLERLRTEAPGIRFLIVDSSGLKAEKHGGAYRRNIYAMMLLARKLTAETQEDSMLYRLLAFYVKSTSGIDDEALSAYLEGLADDALDSVVGVVLKYRPVEQYELPDYDKISKTLVSA